MNIGLNVLIFGMEHPKEQKIQVSSIDVPCVAHVPALSGHTLISL